MEKKFHYKLADNKNFEITIGKVAEQASGSVLFNMEIL